METKRRAVQQLDFEEVKDRKRFADEMRREDLRWRTRRRLAIASFTCIVAILIFYTMIGLFVDDSCVKRIAEFNGIVTTLIGFLAGIVMFYIGVQTWQDKNSSFTRQ